MKQLYLFLALCATVMLVTFSSCGSDDDHGGNGGSYNHGRKLAKLTIKDLKVSSGYIEKGSDDALVWPKEEKEEIEYGDFVFEMGYDTQGRLNRIVCTKGKKQVWDSDKLRYYNEDVPVNAEIALIDYELSTVSVLDVFLLSGETNKYKERMKLSRFALNDKGYITQIGDYSITYDADGFLKEVKATNKMWTAAYRDQEFVGWLEENLKSMSMQTYYVDVNKEKETTFINIKDCRRSDYPEGLIYDLGIHVFAVVAYQCGLLGKITKSYKSITDIKENPISIVTNSEEQKYGYYYNNYREYSSEEAFKIDLEYQ